MCCSRCICSLPLVLLRHASEWGEEDRRRGGDPQHGRALQVTSAKNTHYLTQRMCEGEGDVRQICQLSDAGKGPSTERCVISSAKGLGLPEARMRPCSLSGNRRKSLVQVGRGCRGTSSPNVTLPSEKAESDVPRPWNRPGAFEVRVTARQAQHVVAMDAPELTALGFRESSKVGRRRSWSHPG